MADDNDFTVQTSDGNRVLFRGTEDDARAHVERHFPHVHVQPGMLYDEKGPQPDVFVVRAGEKHDSGSHYVNGEWAGVSGKKNDDDDDGFSKPAPKPAPRKV